MNIAGLSDIYTHSVKIEDTEKGIRIFVHCRAIDRNIASEEAVKLYLRTKKLAEKENIPIAPVESESESGPVKKITK